MLESTKKSFSKRAIRGKACGFDLNTGEDQDLNFNVTTGGAQDEAKLLSKKSAGASSQQKIERSWSDRKNLLRSLSRQQQMPDTSRADFSRHIPTFSFEVARSFLSTTLSNEFGCTRKRVQSSGACDKPVPVTSCNFHF